MELKHTRQFDVKGMKQQATRETLHAQSLYVINDSMLLILMISTHSPPRSN